MHACPVIPILAYRLQDISDNWGMRGGTLMRFDWLAFAVGVLVVLLGIVALRKRLIQARERPRAPRVFRHVAAALGLTLSERRLLVRIARQQALPSPIALLCSPATLAFHADQYGRTVPTRRRAWVRRRVAILRRALFDDAQGQ